jgi:phosphatidylglycerophosphate synthase
MGFIKEAFSTVANWISISRLVMIIPLWVWAAQGRYEWVGYGLIYTMVSDILDGMSARLLNQCSELGEKIDSWGDHLILVSSLIWLFLYRTEIFPIGRLRWMIPAAGFYFITILIGILKHHRFGGAHILEGKPLALFGYMVVILSMFGIYSEVAYFCMIGFWFIHSLVNFIHHFRPDLFNKHQRSLILGLLGLDFEEGPIRYFFS